MRERIALLVIAVDGVGQERLKARPGRSLAAGRWVGERLAESECVQRRNRPALTPAGSPGSEPGRGSGSRRGARSHDR